MKGFTLFELLIAMMLTAVIGTVMFKTWDTVVKSGEKARQAVEGRERERIVFGIMDNDMAAIQHPDAENSSLPRISKEPVLPDEGFYEMMGRKKETGLPGGESMLLSFSTSSSIRQADRLMGAPVCVEYRLVRQSADRYGLKRRERGMCGVSGDFPWDETMLMDNLQTAKMELVFDDGTELETWQPADLDNMPSAIKFSFRKVGMAEEMEVYFPLFARSEEIGWEEKAF